MLTGMRLKKGDPIYCCIDETAYRSKKESHSYNEEATVEEVRLVASFTTLTLS